MTAPVALVLLALSVAVGSHDGLVQQTQPPPVFTVLEGVPPSTDFATLIAGTPVIVAGTVEQLLPAHVDNGLVVQHVLVRVDETIKDHSNRAGPGDVIAVRQYGGRLSVDGRDYITDDSVQRLSVAVAHAAGRMPEFGGRARIGQRELILLLKRTGSPD